jgi:hypothetical protein
MGHRGNARSIVAVAVTMLALAATARADEAEDAALLHLDRGIEAFRAHAYARAHDEFAAAHALQPDRANPYRWLALTEVQLGDCAGAIVHIAEFERRVAAGDPRLAELVRLRVLCKRAEASPAPAPAPARRPIHRRRWFWPAVAGATAVVAGAVVLGVVLSGDDPSRLPPVRCGDAGCTP